MALLKIAPNCKQSQCSLNTKFINKMYYIHTTEYYSAIKKNNVHHATWMNHENFTLNERSQSQNNTYCQNLFVWNVQDRQDGQDRQIYKGRSIKISHCLGLRNASGYKFL